jgi:hypothetical protein
MDEYLEILSERVEIIVLFLMSICGYIVVDDGCFLKVVHKIFIALKFITSKHIKTTHVLSLVSGCHNYSWKNVGDLLVTLKGLCVWL